MARSQSLIGVLSSILLGFGALQASGQTTKPSAGWSPDPAILKQLGAAVTVEKYTLRIPKGYEMQQAKNTPASMKAWGWTGAARKDGSKPSVTLTMVELPAEQIEKTKNLSLEQLADLMIGGMKRQRTNWKQEKAEEGTISGMNFVRIRWEATEPTRKLDMRGFVYVARDGDTIVQIASQDVTPETAKTLPLAETSVLTFKKM